MSQRGERRGGGRRSAGDGGKRVGKGYARFRAALTERLADAPSLEDPSVREVLEGAGEESLAVWVPRLFWDAGSGERIKLLAEVRSLLGEGAGAFLVEVLASSRTSLEEKRRALAAARGIEGGEIENLAMAVEQATRFVEEASPRDAADPADGEARGADASREPFDALPASLRPTVLREILERQGERAVPFLLGLLADAPDRWESALGCVEEQPGEGAARLLTEGYRAARDKRLRKRMRTAHHRRRAKGLEVLPLEVEGTGKAVWSPPVAPRPEGMLSLSDVVGTTMVWVIRSNVPKGMLVFAGVVHDEQGLLNFYLLDVSHREMEKYRDTVLQSEHPVVVESDAGYCAFRLERAFRKQPPRDPEERKLYEAVRPLLREVVPGEEPPPPIHQVFGEEALRDAEGDPLGESAGLLEQPMLRDWRMDRGRLLPRMERIEEASQSRIIVHPLQQKERVEGLYRDATREILADPDHRAAWRRRLAEAAWVFHRKGLGSEAMRLASVGHFLVDPENDASRVGFFVALLRVSLEEMLQAKQAEENERPSLIVKPGQPGQPGPSGAPGGPRRPPR